MYLVTGATGNVGSEVTAQLLAAGRKVRVFTRDPGKVTHWRGQAQVVVGDFQQPDTFVRGVTDVEAVFLMNRGLDPKSFSALIDAAKVNGAPRIVFLSTLQADSPSSDIGSLHKQMEDTIRAAGLQGKFIRPGGFMSNCYQWIGTIKGEGAVHNPMGTGKLAPIAPEDIAAVAVQALTNPDLRREAFEVTGGELLSVPEQVNVLSKVIGKPIRCIDISVDAAVQALIRTGIPPQAATAVGQTFQTIRDGRDLLPTDTVERVTGRRPMSFEAWVRKHASRFA